MAQGPEADRFEQLREDVARIFERIGAIEGRLERLEPSAGSQEVSGEGPPLPAVASHLGAGPEEPIEAVLVEDGPASVAGGREIAGAEPDSGPPAAGLLPAVTTHFSGSAPASPPAAASSPLRDMGAFEQLVGGRWLTWAGGLTMLIAIGFFIPWAWRYFSTPDWVKVAALHLASWLLLAAGYPFYRRGLPLLGQVLAGLGIFAWYGTALAALRTFDAYEKFFGTWKHEATFIECSLITIVAIGLAVRTRGLAIALVGALGGYLNPILTSGGRDDYIILFAYLAFLNVALIACAVVREWNFLKPLAVVATAIMFALHLANATHIHAWHLEWLAVLHTLIFWAGVTLPPVVWRRPSQPDDLAALVGSSMGFMGLSWHLFHNWETQQLGLLSWGLALLHAGLFGLTRARVSNEDRMPRTHLALAVVFLTLSAPLQLDNFSYLATAWALEGLAFMAIGTFFGDRQMIFSAGVVFVLAAIRHLGFDLHDVPAEFRGLTVDFRAMLFASTGLIMICSGTMAWWIPRRGRYLSSAASFLTRPNAGELAAAGAALGIGNLLLLTATACQWSGRLTLVLWTLDMSLIWLAGLYWQRAAARWYAGTIVAAMVLIRAAVHADSYQEPFRLLANDRFASLALLAVALFLVSWGYRKFGMGKSLNSSPADGRPGDGPRTLEILAEYLVGIAGHVVLFIAINMEILTWYQLAKARPVRPFANMQMAELATYSVVWASYAAAMVVMGFVLKSRFYRLLGLLAFLPILAKVFLIDLAQLDQLARVLATFALGISLLGVSFLYQRLTSRGLDSPAAP
ncbi:MAG: DUF2339 domain-containing protein [Planctomycetales bacterium]|nr:DUF2339 domain-containing protein [Planctomycetales bacterium]NIM08164.1 DUF2339 domain-containing protein [Planctomycetales bacterium]NIN07661.1 DUF2339 domain-containing protein [Planctomycetales bacterium]NIN76778.1 DUF2339 domain-containing protein [Planctomycetales bacterium]NIO33987.1 DUF2339 domain-containing protein [Planctomycetales bacterium]